MGTSPVNARGDAEKVATAGDLDEVISLGVGLPLPGAQAPLVHELVRRCGRIRPTQPAVLSGGASLNYGELDAWAGQISARLVKSRVGRGSHVAIAASPSTAMVAAVLGIVRAGAAYVPIEPKQPKSRIVELLRDAQVTHAIVTEGNLAVLADSGLEAVVEVESQPTELSTVPDEETKEAPLSASDAVYVIYTSGSTGDPKGVLVEHGQLAASTEARRLVYPKTPVFLLISPLVFDSCAAGLWGTLTGGGRLVVATSDEVRDPERLVELVHTHHVTHTLCIPSLYGHVLDAAERLGVDLLSSLEAVILAGEELTESLLLRHFALLSGSAALVNEYGPTETTVWASYRHYDSPGPVSIGTPIPGARLYILDDDLRPVARGAEGELVVGGAGVARGYFGRPEETARVFFDDPFTPLGDGRMYRTGDRVRWNEEGGLEFLGRRDHQVKIRGQRVELGAVEAALRALADVRDAVVVPDGARTHLAAFVIPSDTTTPESIRARLAETLPPTLVPAPIRCVTSFPLTVSGKIDRRALADVVGRAPTVPSSITPRADDPGASGAGVDARALVMAAWAQVLEAGQIPPDVNFFDLGGHSLGMFALQDALERHTGVRPSIVDLFQHTTVSAQAALIGSQLSQTAETTLASIDASSRAEGSSATATWLARPHPQTSPECRLICFPHAGGSASFFRDWGSYLPAVEVYAVRYPGRAERIDEPPPRDLRELGREIAIAVAPLAQRPLVLFGHSMGAVVALETARFLEARAVRIRYLVASGSRNGFAAVDDSRGESGVSDESDDAVRLVELGGTDPDVAADPEFLELVLPYVRADSAMFHAYTFELEPRLQCPITTIVGDEDADADRRPWADLTDASFREKAVKGDHFYLTSNPPYALLRECISADAEG